MNVGLPDLFKKKLFKNLTLKRKKRKTKKKSQGEQHSF